MICCRSNWTERVLGRDVLATVVPAKFELNLLKDVQRNMCQQALMNNYENYENYENFQRKKRPNIEVLNLKKVMLHRVIYGYYCMEGRDEFTLMCKFSPRRIVHLNIKRISHFG